MSEEIGRELKASELKPESVVIVKPPGDNKPYITLWVKFINPRIVEFYAGELKWHILNFIKDDEIFDDQDRRVRVFEYLGKI